LNLDAEFENSEKKKTETANNSEPNRCRNPNTQSRSQDTKIGVEEISEVPISLADHEQCLVEREPRKGFRMLTKSFLSKELLPFGQLRTLSQKDLLHSLEENAKLGIVIKDQIKVAMIDMGQYEKMIDALQDYERLLDLLEEREIHERIKHRLEREPTTEYKEGMSIFDLAGVHL
jgi:hypothetical protein